MAHLNLLLYTEKMFLFSKSVTFPEREHGFISKTKCSAEALLQQPELLPILWRLLHFISERTITADQTTFKVSATCKPVLLGY